MGDLNKKREYERRVAKWVEGQVSSYKYLRGGTSLSRCLLVFGERVAIIGVVAIPEVPKR